MQRRARGDHELLKSRVHAVRCDDDVSRRATAVGEMDDGLRIILLEGDASVASLHDVGRQPFDEHSEQVGAVYPVELDLTHRLGRPHRRDIDSVRAAILRVQPSGPAAGQLVSEAKPSQHPDAVRLERDAGADFSQRLGLLVNTDVHALLKQGVGSGEATDAAADDRNAQRVRAHGESGLRLAARIT
jgi:hypothetical protein